MFPLHTVLFPGAVLPLHIFEQRYRQLVQEGRDFGVVLIREGREVGSVPSVHEVGTLAHLEQVEALPDGRFNVVCKGMARFRIERLLEPDPYLLADITLLEEPPAPAGMGLLARLEEYLGLHGLSVAPQLSAATGKRAVWLAGAVLQAEPPKRQALLESGDPELAEALLAAEIAKLRGLGALAPVPPPGFSPN